MPQGYKANLTFTDAGTPYVFDFKRITVDDGTTELDISSKILPDGSVNISADGLRAFTATEGDLATLAFTCHGLLSTTNLDFIAAFTPGILYDTVSWAIQYDGVTYYNGTSFFFQGTTIDASIPGTAEINMRFKSSGKIFYP